MTHQQGRLVAVLVVLLAAQSAQPTGQAATDDLFSPANELAFDGRRDDMVRRRREAAAFPERLFTTADVQSAVGRIRLNLFPDAEFVALLDTADESHAGFRTWVGHLEGDRFSEITLTTGGGVLVGSVHAGATMYEIRATSSGATAIEEIDVRRLPIGGDTLRPPARSSPLPPADLGPEDASRIDLLVMYTAAAEAAEGGGTGVQARVAQSIRDTNTAYSNSGVLHRVRLVGVEPLAFDEAPSSMLPDLRMFAIDAHVADRRNALGADLVMLIEDRSREPQSGYVFDACGWGYVLTPHHARPSEFAFSVIDHACLGGSYAFTHELGHNMGADHGTRQLPTGPVTDVGAFLYSKGYADPAGRFRTVMTYPDSCIGPCPVVRHFSNPAAVEIDRGIGATTGFVDTDNARTLNEMASTIANFRQTVLPVLLAPTAPTNLAALLRQGSVTLSWTASTGAASYILQVGTNSGSANAFNGSVGAELIVSGPIPEGTYFWRVIAVDLDGQTTSSAEARFSTSTAPDAPTGLRAQVNGNQVTLSWNAAADSVEVGSSPATNYIVQVGTSVGASNLFDGAVGNTTSVSGNLANGTYYWRVIAVNAAGSSSASAESQLTVGCASVPASPQDLTASIAGSLVTLAWTASPGPPTAEYQIEAGSSRGAANLLTRNTGVTATTFTAAAPPGTYYVRLRAVNACGVSTATPDLVVSVVN